MPCHYWDENVTEPVEGTDRAVLGTAVLFCESCRRETPHRILRFHRSDRPVPRSVRGIARCRECRWTHAFVSTQVPRAVVEVIVSRGPASERRPLELDASEPVRVGESVAGVEPKLLVRRIDRRDGTSPRSAVARDVSTIWAVEERPRLVRVAVLEGARSTTERVEARAGARWAVGDALRLPSGPVTVVALRARNRTWRRAGDAFPSEEVAVVYGRRTVSPPAGRSAWRRERETPRSRASSVSRVPRSRSSPGVRRNRTVPRARTADGGATARSSSRS